MTAAEVSIGVVTRTGSAVAIALRGTASAPAFLHRLEIMLAAPGLPVQPYHVAAGLDAGAATALITDVEQAVQEAASAGLRTLTGALPARVRAVTVVVKPVSLPADLADVVRSHPRMHAAEGVLYREGMLAAARDCGLAAVAVDGASLPLADQALAAIGLAAGRPWRRIEKDAARAALTCLP